MKFKSLPTLIVLSLMVAIPNTGLGRTISLKAEKHELKGDWAIAPQYAFSPDASKVLTLNKGEGSIYIWSTVHGSLLETLKNDYNTSQAAWSSDGKSIIVYGVKNKQRVVTLWNVSHLAE